MFVTANNRSKCKLHALSNICAKFHENDLFNCLYLRSAHSEGLGKFCYMLATDIARLLLISLELHSELRK